MRYFLPINTTVLLAAFALVAGPVAGAADPLSNIRLPPGFRIHVYAADIPDARSMARSPAGTLFVGNRKDGRVYALQDRDGDFQIDRRYTLARGLTMPNGVAFRRGDLYVAEVHRIFRWRRIEDHLTQPPAPEIIRDDLPKKKWHGWKFIRFGPDGKLYFPIGAPCNVCLSDNESFASILRMNPDGSELELFARGVRNTVGFDWHPQTRTLWFTDNGRDWLGDDTPPDELNHAPRPGLHFGFPYLHGVDVKDPVYHRKMPRIAVTLPVKALGPHVAALGMRFYTGTSFPATYRHRIFIAEHGSWNRSVPVGYRITTVTLNPDNSPQYEVFAEGWLDDGKVTGRPVDLEILPDGSMLVSDDYAGRIYRIHYTE